MNLISKSIVLGALILGHTLGEAQSVVLVNGEAKRVRISGSTIVSIDSSVAGYMAGFTNAQDGFIHAPLRTEDSPAADVVVATNRSEPIVTTKITSTSSIKSSQYILFEHEIAELNKLAKKGIRMRAVDIVAGIARTVLLEGIYNAESKEDKNLIVSRLDNCKSLLEKSGVGSNVIITNLRPGRETSDKISITLR